MTREPYRRSHQVIDITDFEEIDFEEEVLVSLPRFAWLVARSYLSIQAQWLSSYATEYFSNGYDTPSSAQMDEIQENIAEFLAAEVDMPQFIVGQIVMYGGSFLPDKFLWCNGETFDAFDYAELFSVIGYVYGVDGGDPKTPDLLYRFPLGSNISHPRGEEGGTDEETLVVAEMPAHTHLLTYLKPWSASGPGMATNGAYGPISASGALSSTGGGAAHNNMPPYLAVPFMIYAGV